jgi:subtilisin family serine protease
MHRNHFFVWLRRRGFEVPLSRVYLFLALAGTFFGAGQKSLAAISPEFRPDQILIQPKKNVSPAALTNFHARQQSQVVKTFANVGRIQVLRVPNNETVPGLIAKYQNSGLVEFAEPDYIVHADATPNDPKYLDGTFWGLNNTGQNGGTPDADIDAPEAWDVLNSASNVVVAVLDTGIRYTHEDLASNMWVNPIDGGHGFNAFTGTNDVSDDNGHGTIIAGLLGGVGNNGKGIVGVAWHVQLMACKCLNSSASGSDSTVIACIDYARTNGAQIMNASLDSPGSSLAVSNAIAAARDAGIIFVASAGNGNPGTDVDVNPTYPACYDIDNIVSVAYTTRTDGLGGLSNYGATNVDLAAPGDMMYSTYYVGDASYYPPAFFSINLAGTSLSAAYVSGAFALMVAKYPAENYHQIIQRVLKAVDPVPALAGKCVTGGRLNLWKALSPPINLTSVPGNNGAPFQLHVSTGANRTCVIESSPDLLSWSPIFTNTTAANGTFDFVDNNATNAAQRFYRAVAAP